MQTKFKLELPFGVDEIYANYTNGTIYLEISCMYNSFWILNSSTCNGATLSEKEYKTFEEICNEFSLPISTDGWLTDNSEPLSKYLKEAENSNKNIENISVDTLEDKDYKVNIKTTDIGHGESETTIENPVPVKLDEETMQKQAEYIAEALKPKKEEVETQDTYQENNTNSYISTPYTEKDFYNDVQNVDLRKLEKILKIKKAILFTSAPGTGKTTTAIALANYIVGETNSKRVKLVSFSQTTSYTNIIGGIGKEKGRDWETIKGSLFSLCDEALRDPDTYYIYIIDEINRANTESALGESITALSKRGVNVDTNINFTLNVPDNVLIIATMNSTDHSITQLDTALVDRFAIYRMKEVPAKDIDFKKIKPEADEELYLYMEEVAIKLEKINKSLATDQFKGEDNIIGLRALYTDYTDIEGLECVVEYDIIPKVNTRLSSLSENEKGTVKGYIKELRDIFKK